MQTQTSVIIKIVQPHSKCHKQAKSFPGQGRNDGEMQAGRATWTGILLLRLNNKGTTEGRKTRLANSACANRRRLVEGAQQSKRETRESSRFPAIPFVTKGGDVIRMPILIRSTRVKHLEENWSIYHSTLSLLNVYLSVKSNQNLHDSK